MAYLLIIKDNLVLPNPEALVIYPFNKIWKRDKDRNKKYALEDFIYIEFSISMLMSNPYRGYDSKIKKSIIIKDIITRDKWKEDDLIKEGLKKIEKFQTDASPSWSFFETALITAEGLKNSLKTISKSLIEESDIIQFDQKELKERTAALANIGKLLGMTDIILGALIKTKKKVEEELFDVVKTKSQKVISPFADPESL